MSRFPIFTLLPLTILSSLLCLNLSAAHKAMTLKESLSPYKGVSSKINNDSIYNKIMTGYQGWFLADGDGYGAGFIHWGNVDRDPPHCTIDFWPDMSELDADEKFYTNYKYPNGSRAPVFSSTVKKTVMRHFKWMRDYGIDGAWIQRFGAYIKNQNDWNYRRACAVLYNCREGANRYGRTFAVMYDVDFSQRTVANIKADWLRLINEMKITTTPAYVRHRGAPVVSLWGYGFNSRRFDAAAAEDLFKFFKDPKNGGCTIMLGVPNDWVRWSDAKINLLKKYAHIISPWNVGRYRDTATAKKHFKKHWPKDLKFCKDNDKDYYAVVFPGFSWENLQRGRSDLNQIPRKRGRFLWDQIKEVKRYKMNMAYVAMFDEVDEGTAIFKCSNNPPMGRFCTYEGLPSDYYLKLTGAAGKFLRGQEYKLPSTRTVPGLKKYRPMSKSKYYKTRGR